MSAVDPGGAPDRPEMVHARDFQSESADEETSSGNAMLLSAWTCRHLYHDREEVAVHLRREMI